MIFLLSDYQFYFNADKLRIEVALDSTFKSVIRLTLKALIPRSKPIQP